jgi:hypothetical protein
MRSHVAAALAAVLARQQHVITSRQIVDAGCDSELATREVVAGRWQRPAFGIYFAFAGAPSLLQRAWCAQLIGGQSSRVSGPLACQLLGIADASGGAAVVLVSKDCQRTGSNGCVVRRTSRLPDVADRNGLRLVGAARAVVDAARHSPGLREVRAVVCAALNGKHATYDELLAELHAEPRPGLALLRRALRDWADGARSAPEAEVADALREQVHRRAMPPFLLNPEIHEGPVLLGALDVYVPGRSLGAEVDSVRHHGAEDSLDATLTRHAVMTRAGLELEHVTPTRFRRSAAAWAATFAALAEQRRGRGDPSGLRIEPVGPLQDGRGRRRT